MSKSPGRHRAPSRLSTVSLSDAVARTGQPVAKASAVLAVSGGLVATVAAPTSAAPLGAVAHGTATPMTTVHREVAPVAVSAADAPMSAVAAPATAPLVASPSFGKIGFTGNKAPEPEPVVEPEPEPVVEPEPEPVVERETTEPSRSTERESLAEREAAEREAAEREAAEKAAAERRAQEQAEQEQQEQAEASAPSSAGSGVLGIAAQYVGTPYAYGGSSPAGFDCSGFTQYVFGQAGISLPRTTSAQQAAATPVSNPQPGDLVFFGYPAHHVGIYAGGGMMYDSGRPGVPVSKRAIFHSSGPVSYGRI